MKVFLSYSREDRAEVTPLKADLTDLGHSVWIDDQLNGGQKWWDTILKSIRGCDIYVLALSPSVVYSQYCLAELGYARAVSRAVVPVMVIACDLNYVPPEISDRHFVDYTAGEVVRLKSLARTLGDLPAAVGLPKPLPDAPQLPRSPLYELSQYMRQSDEIDSARQLWIVDKLEELSESARLRDDVLELLKLFRGRSEILARVLKRVEVLLSQLEGQSLGSNHADSRDDDVGSGINRAYGSPEEGLSTTSASGPALEVAQSPSITTLPPSTSPHGRPVPTASSGANRETVGPADVLQLSAHQYCERALTRPVDDIAGKIADYDEAIRLDPKFADAFNGRGLIRASQGDLDGAMADYNRAIRLNPQFAGFNYNRGNFLAAKGDLDGAIADYNQAIRLDPEFAGFYYGRGICRRDRGDLDGAIADLDEALRLDPALAEAFGIRGLIRASRGDLDGAMADYDEAIRLDPQFAGFYHHRGICRSDRGDLDGAIVDLDEAIRLDPEFAGFYHHRGICRSDRGDLDGAIADLDEALRLDPQFADAFNGRGLIRAGRGDLDGAMADYDRAISLNPNDAIAFKNRGLARSNQGDLDGAIADYNKAIRLNPAFAKDSTARQVAGKKRRRSKKSR
jgi:tetratricopeptide (TPR) repeat protein